MVREGAYVGEHSPRVTLPGGGAAAGLMQERLGLQDGREYVGRIVLAADGSAAPLEVSLVWGGGATDRQTVTISPPGSGFATHALRFRARGTTDNGRLEIVSRGTGSFRIGTVSLMPADNILGWRADTLALLKELELARLPLAGRQLRQRLRLEGRHRRPRPPAAAQEPGLEGHRAQRRRASTSSWTCAA